MTTANQSLTVALSLALLGFCSALDCQGAEFPLETVSLGPSEALSLPGVSGTLLYLAQPEGLRKEPPATSSRPLYGTLDTGRILRVDESGGTGRGYDRVLVDLNGDGSLMDEKPYPALEAKRLQSSSGLKGTFGPIQMTRSGDTGAFLAAFYASLTLYHPQRLLKGQIPAGFVAGFMNVKPAAYLKARVEIDGVVETVGFVDGSGDLRVGDVAQFSDSARPKPREWEWMRTDYLFRDKDGSGKFERRLVRDELELLGNPIFFAGKPFRASFPATGQLRLEPYANLGTLQVTSQCTLESLVLLRRTTAANWEVLVPQVRSNAVQVPGGLYRLFSCCYSMTSGKDRFFGRGFMNTSGEAIEIRPDQTVLFPCGPPLKATVSAAPGQGAQPSLLASLQRDVPTVSLRAHLRGLGGETYTAFYRGSRAPQVVVPAFPRYEITGHWFGHLSGALRPEPDGSFSKVVSVPSPMVEQPASVTVSFDLAAVGFASSATATEPIEIKAP